MASLHRLDGISGGVGGLIVKKKETSTQDDTRNSSGFKSPKASILGLDKLAAAKRNQQVSFIFRLKWHF